METRPLCVAIEPLSVNTKTPTAFTRSFSRVVSNMVPQKRKRPNPSNSANTTKKTKTSSGPRAVKKSKISFDQSVENEYISNSSDSSENDCNANLVSNCSDNLGLMYSHSAVDATMYCNAKRNSNSNKFKKIIIVEENVNNQEELNPSTDYNVVVCDWPSTSNDYIEPLHEYGQDETITLDEDEDSDDCEQNDCHELSSDEDEDKDDCKQNECIEISSSNEDKDSDDCEQNDCLDILSDEDENSDDCEQNDCLDILSDEDENSDDCEQNDCLDILSDEDEDSDDCEQNDDDRYIECVPNDLLTTLEENVDECSFMSDHNEVVTNNMHDHQIKNNVLKAQDNTNVIIKKADIVIDLSDDSDSEEVYNEKDYVNLSRIKYCDYRCEPEYLKIVFPEFCLQMLLNLHSRFHKVKKSDPVLSYSGDRIGLNSDSIERIFLTNIWFNGDSINCYLKLLCRGREETYFTFDSYLLEDFRIKGYESTVKRTEGVDIFSKKVLFLPVHLAGTHWALLYIDVQNHISYFIDSLSDYEAACEKEMNDLIDYLTMEYRMKKKTDMKGYWSNLVADISPIQYNHIDCGAFVCLNAKDLIRDKIPNFEQEDIPLLRVKIIHELLTDQLIE